MPSKGQSCSLSCSNLGLSWPQVTNQHVLNIAFLLPIYVPYVSWLSTSLLLTPFAREETGPLKLRGLALVHTASECWSLDSNSGLDNSKCGLLTSRWYPYDSHNGGTRREMRALKKAQFTQLVSVVSEKYVIMDIMRHTHTQTHTHTPLSLPSLLLLPGWEPQQAFSPIIRMYWVCTQKLNFTSGRKQLCKVAESSSPSP